MRTATTLPWKVCAKLCATDLIAVIQKANKCLKAYQPQKNQLPAESW